jgi:hypothetical protein
VPAREPARLVDDGADEAVADDDDDSVSDPADPDAPVRSAHAAGIATTAEPIPNATARTPTRPTKVA